MKAHLFCRAVACQLSLAAILLVVPFLTAQGQTWTQYDQGTPPQHAAGVSSVGSYLSTDLGTVNLTNGALNISLPMGTTGGRGFTLPIALNYSSKVWSVAHDTAYWPRPHDMDVDMAYARYGAADNYEDLFDRVAPGWTIGGLPILKRQAGSFPGCESYSLYALDKLTVILPDKGEIELRDDLTDGSPLFMNCTPNGDYRGQSWHAVDGSGAIFISDHDNGIANSDLDGTLVTRDGMRYRFATVAGGVLARATSLTDRNGNQITINRTPADPNGKITTEYIDQLGRSTKVEQNAPDPDNGSIILPLLVTQKGYQATPQYYKVKVDRLSNHIRSDFNYNQQPIRTGSNDRIGYCYGGGQPPAANYLFPDSYCGFQERIDTKGQVSQVILPDGRSLQFSYDLYGEVAEVVLPTGGKLQYDYTGFTETGFPSGNTLGGEYQGQLNQVQDIDRAVTARRTYPDGTTLEETSAYLFGPQTVNGSSSACTEVKAYAGTVTGGTLLSDQRHFFLPAGRYLTGSHGSTHGTGYSLWSTGLEWRTEILNSTGGVISATEQDWAQRTPVSWPSSLHSYAQEQPGNDNRVSESRRYLDTGSFARTATFYDNINYPRANNLSEVKEYDFDLSLKRRSTTSYVTGIYQTDNSIHLLGLVQQQSIFDRTGTNEVARAVNEYDVYTGDGNHATLQDYGSVIGHDASYGTSKIARGNLTAVGHWLKTNNTTLYSYLRYDTLGNTVGNKDANGNLTTLSYTDDFGNGSNPGGGVIGAYGATYAFPTLITSPPPQAGQVPHTARTQYDFSTDLLTGFKDRNGIIAQTIYSDPVTGVADPFNRPRLVKAALGVSGVEVHSAMYYAPMTTPFGIMLTNNDVLIAKDQASVDDATLRWWTRTDGFGRAVEAWSRDPQSDVKVATIYDALGRPFQQSNPFRPSQGETALYTTTAYDLANRQVSITTPDNAVVTTSYSGSQMFVKDQAGKQRMSNTNALGQLKDVWEITTNDPVTYPGIEPVSFPDHADVAAAYHTTYDYDALDDLTSVTQGTQPARSFVFDSLKRLTSATNPESGTISYQYDNNGNLTQKTDARSVHSNYAYDALNRNTGVTYTNDSANTPAITRSYDGATNGKGRPSAVSSSVAAYTYSGYDALGRVRAGSQTLGGQTYSLSYFYDLAGHVKSMTYPSGRIVTNSYDAAGRLNSLTGNLGDGVTRTYSTGLTYAAGGQMSQEQFGTDTAVYNKLFYNTRQQLSEIRESTTPNDTSWNRGAIINHYSDYCWGMCTGSAMTDNNGNLKSQDVYIPNNDQITSYATWRDHFDYDSLNRLQRVHEYADVTHDWQQEYVYDRWGNRTVQQDQTKTWGTGIPKPNFTVNTSNNRLGAPLGQSGVMAYDNAGNLTTDTYSGAAVARAYDAENRMTSETQANNYVAGSYNYDGDGRRVKRNVNGVETWQVYGMGGELLAEYAANAAASSPQKEYGYRNGQLLLTAAGVAGPVDLALGKTATQSSTLVSGSATFSANLAIDGNTDTNFTHLTSSSTNSGYQSWWQVDLGSRQQIGAIQVWSRADCCWDQTYNFYVLVSDNPFTSTDLTATLNQAGVTNYWVTGGNAAMTSENISRTGRYVRIQRNDTNYLVLPEVKVISGGAAQTGTQNVVWTNTFGVTVSGNNLTKEAWAGNGWVTGAAASEQAIVSGDGYVEWTASETTSHRMIGLSHGDSNRDYTDIDYGFYTAAGGILYILENGVGIGTFGTYATGNTLRVAVEGGVVKYRKNGTLLYTSTVAPAYPLLVDTSIHSIGATLTNVVISGNLGAGSGGGKTTDIEWLVTDQLGTPRMIFDKTGSLANTKRHDYLPFGEELTANQGVRTTTQGYSTPDGTRQKFTSQERDNETGLDYFLARYYSSTQGRFTSPDSYGGRLVNPQTFNLYSYVRNNPLKYVDPTGHQAEQPKKKGKKGNDDEAVTSPDDPDCPSCPIVKIEGHIPTPTTSQSLDNDVETHNNGVAQADQRFRDDVTKAQLEWRNVRRRLPDTGRIVWKDVAGVGIGVLGAVISKNPAGVPVGALVGFVAAYDEESTQEAALKAAFGTLVTAVQKAEIDLKSNLPKLSPSLAARELDRSKATGEPSRLKGSTINLAGINEWVRQLDAYLKK